jgi:hypothetical protein
MTQLPDKPLYPKIPGLVTIIPAPNAGNGRVLPDAVVVFTVTGVAVALVLLTAIAPAATVPMTLTPFAPSDVTPG